MYVRHEKCRRAAAPTLLLVHGFPLDHSMWDRQLPLASKCSILAPDLFGFGASDKLAQPASMRLFADDLAMLLDCLELETVIYCGLSMGGYIGWEFFKHHRSRVSGMICCNTRAAADGETMARARRVAALQVMETGSVPVAEAMRDKLFSEATLQGDPGIAASMFEVMKNVAPESIAGAQLAMSSRTDHVEGLCEFDVPTLVVAGQHDTITPAAEMQEMAKLIPGANFVSIEAAGHMSPLEQSVAFNEAVVRFLETFSSV